MQRPRDGLGWPLYLRCCIGPRDGQVRGGYGRRDKHILAPSASAAAPGASAPAAAAGSPRCGRQVPVLLAAGLAECGAHAAHCAAQLLHPAWLPLRTEGDTRAGATGRRPQVHAATFAHGRPAFARDPALPRLPKRPGGDVPVRQGCARARRSLESAASVHPAPRDADAASSARRTVPPMTHSPIVWTSWRISPAPETLRFDKSVLVT